MYGNYVFWTTVSVRCPELGGGRFSEVSNVLALRKLQSVPRSLPAFRRSSASRRVRYRRFYCSSRSVDGRGAGCGLAVGYLGQKGG